jgi:hypothetical protein
MMFNPMMFTPFKINTELHEQNSEGKWCREALYKLGAQLRHMLLEYRWRSKQLVLFSLPIFDCKPNTCYTTGSLWRNPSGRSVCDDNF